MSIARKGFTNPDFLGEAIKEELEKYAAEVDATMQKETDKIAKEVLTDLKNNPNIPKKTGEYKKSFYIKKIAQGQGYKRVAIANRKYQLTHLLEKGHVTRNGKRTRAFPHWADAQKKAETLYNRMLEVLGK